MKENMKDDELYLIAEIGLSKGTDVGLIAESAERCNELGFDAVKLQYHIPDEIHRSHHLYSTISQFFVDEEWVDQVTSAIFDVCELDVGITGYCPTAMKHLTDLHKSNCLDFIKVSAIESGNPFIWRALKGYMDGGGRVIASYNELDGLSYVHLRSFVVDWLATISQYPCPAESFLSRVPALIKNCPSDNPPGYSDHTVDSRVVENMIAMGSRIVEMHVNTFPYTDSVDKNVEWKEGHYLNIELIEDLRFRSIRDETDISSRKCKKAFENVLVTKNDVKCGEFVSMEDLTSMRSDSCNANLAMLGDCFVGHGFRWCLDKEAGNFVFSEDFK